VFAQNTARKEWVVGADLKGLTKNTNTRWELGWLDGQEARAWIWRFILKAWRVGERLRSKEEE